MNQILWALVAQTGVIVAGCVVIILHNSARFAAIDKRIDGLRSEMNHRFDDLKDWIRSEARRLEEWIGRLERPVLKG